MKTLLRGKGLIMFLALVALVIVGLFQQPTQAAPPAAPTPLANYITTGVQARAFNFQPTTVITADTNTSGVDVINLGRVDVQYVVDQGATTNTLTITSQFSNDNSNWVSGPALLTTSSVDGSDITSLPVIGRYMRFTQVVTGSASVTITLSAVGR